MGESKGLQGRCRVCGGPSDAPRSWYCAEHREEVRREQKRESSRRRRPEKPGRIRGVCEECGTPAYKPGAYRCELHFIERRRERGRKRMEERRREDGVLPRSPYNQAEMARAQRVTAYWQRQNEIRTNLKRAAQELLWVIRESEERQRPIRVKEINTIARDLRQAVYHQGRVTNLKRGT